MSRSDSWLEAAKEKPYLSYALKAIDGLAEVEIKRLFGEIAPAVARVNATSIDHWIQTRKPTEPGFALDGPPSLEITPDYQILAILALAFSAYGLPDSSAEWATKAAFELGRQSRPQRVGDSVAVQVQQRREIGVSVSAAIRAADIILASANALHFLKSFWAGDNKLPDIAEIIEKSKVEIGGNRQYQLSKRNAQDLLAAFKRSIRSDEPDASLHELMEAILSGRKLSGTRRKVSDHPQVVNE